MTIENIDRSDDDTPVSFEGIPPEWEIKSNQIKLHCVDGKPIELGRGGFGVVLFGNSYSLPSPLPECQLAFSQYSLSRNPATIAQQADQMKFASASSAFWNRDIWQEAPNIQRGCVYLQHSVSLNALAFRFSKISVPSEC